MIETITNNLGTIITGLVVFGAVALIVIKMIRDKRKGKRLGCNCGCADCQSKNTAGSKDCL